MIALSLSVLSSTWIFVVFKLYDVYKVQTLVAIIVNYITACLVGLTLYKGTLNVSEIIGSSWIWGPVFMGVLFITIFNLMAKTSQVAGVSVASVATKMSLVIPVLLGMLLYNERLSFIEVAGIVLALTAVYLVSAKGKGLHVDRKHLILPFLVFLGSGVIDASIKYFEEVHLSDHEIPIFSSMIFGFAALSGLFFIAFKSNKSEMKLNLKNILGGVALGIPNYFSIYFLIQALRSDLLSSAAVFTINNVAIVMLSTLVGILLFKEKLSAKNWGGVAIAILSIILVALF
ncbi:EamA family transporter [Flagellimonas sp. GZD32]|uniref:EamA family transporter n=1 Tax=Flagellimonas cixiensis TaxID=3228750 RepID=UPI0035C8A7A4